MYFNLIWTVNLHLALEVCPRILIISDILITVGYNMSGAILSRLGNATSQLWGILRHTDRAKSHVASEILNSPCS